MKILEEIRKYLERFNINLEQTTNEIKFGEPIELEEKDYEEFSEFLKKQGFLPVDTWEDKIIDAYNHRRYIGVDIYSDNNNTEIKVYYTMIIWNDKVTYFLKRIKIELCEPV